MGTGGKTKSHCGGAHTLTVVGVHELGKSSSKARRGNEHHLGIHLHVLKQDFRLRDTAQAHSRFSASNNKTWVLVPNGQKAADAFLIPVLVENPGKHKVEARHASTGYPVLLPVEDVAVASPVSPSGHLRGCTTGLGLGYADRRLVPG